MSETQWMTLLETASLMKKLPTQVTRMCEDGKLEYYREDGRYFVSRESIDLFMHPQSGSQGSSIPDVNGTSRRKYGQAPEEIGETDTPVSEPGTANGQATEDAVMEENPAITPDEVVSEDDDAGKSKIDTELENFIKSCESTGKESPDDTTREPAEAGEPLDAVTESRQPQTPDGEGEFDVLAGSETVDTTEAIDTTEAVDTTEAIDTTEAVEMTETDETPEAAEMTEAANEPETTEAEDTVVAVETVGAATPAEEAVRDEREVSAVIPEASTRQVAEILADLRESVARQAVAHEAFCDEISRLADALEATLTKGEDKTSELTREISSLLARYSKR